jgi:hypothetical protein
VKKRWIVQLGDGKPHEVTLEETWTTPRRVRVDGTVVVDEQIFSNLAREYLFDCGGHPCRLNIGRGYFVIRRRDTLTVDGQDIAEGV